MSTELLTESIAKNAYVADEPRYLTEPSHSLRPLAFESWDHSDGRLTEQVSSNVVTMLPTDMTKDCNGIIVILVQGP